MATQRHYDLFVIGAGPGGYTAALLGAKKGLKVGIAEASQFGGTCTNRGCIPAKSYIESIKVFTHLKNAKRFGIDAGPATLTLENLLKRKTRIVSRLVKAIEYLLNRSGVEIFRGYAHLESEDTVLIGDDRIRSSSIIIATGSRPKRPALFDLEGVLTSDEIFNLSQPPSSLVIVGGGVIGLEMAHVFSNLGTEVIVVEALERILSSEDEEVSIRLASQYKGVRFITKARIKAVQRPSGFKLLVEAPGGQDTLTSEALLLCIGREPVLPEGIRDLGVALTQLNGLKVDPSMRTNIKGVYAIGDVTGEQMYAYVASKEAAVAVDNITGGSQTMDYSSIPSVIFTDPEIASVGRSMDQMDLATIRRGSFQVSALGRARTMEASEGFATVYCDPDGRMKRVTIMAPHATELISWPELAIAQGLHIDEFLKPLCPHPTMAELIKEASEDVSGLSIHKP